MNEKAQDLEYMISTAGWKWVESYISDRIEAHKSQLLTCPIEDVPKHRAKAKALNGVLLYIHSTIREGSEMDA